MKISKGAVRLLAIVSFFLIGILLIYVFAGPPKEKRPKLYTYSQDLEYLKFMHLHHPDTDQRLAFLLLLDYLNKGRYDEGYHFFSKLIDQYGDDLESNQRALYLNSLAMLLASKGETLSQEDKKKLLKETIQIIQTSQEQFDENDFLNQFLVTLTFSKFIDDPRSRQEAIKHFESLEKMHKNTFQKGLMREIYHQLARIFQKEGNEKKANHYLKLSGFDSFDSQGSFFTSFSVSKEFGYISQPKEILEIVPGVVYQVSGFGVSDIAFVISEDSKELIAIGAMTQPDQARRAYEYFKQQVPEAPQATVAIIIHSDWDEIGGFQFFRRLNENIDFYASENFAKSLEFYKRAKVPFNYLYGTSFSKELLDQFKPNKLISKPTTITVGGTDLDLIPMGKSSDKVSDHLFIYLPKYEILFVGDFITPFFGSSYVQGIPLNEIFAMIDLVIELNPKQIVFSYSLLNEEWSSVENIVDLKQIFLWMSKEVQTRVDRGESLEMIKRANLIPPLLLDMPHLEYAYFHLREPMIDLVFEDSIQKFSSQLPSSERLTDQELGIMLTEYLDLSEERIVEIVQRMMDNGEFTLASKVATWGLTRFPESQSLNDHYRFALLKLKEKYQFTNPIKFIIYSEMLDDETPQLKE